MKAELPQKDQEVESLRKETRDLREQLRRNTKTDDNDHRDHRRDKDPLRDNDREAVCVIALTPGRSLVGATVNRLVRTATETRSEVFYVILFF